MRKMKKINGYLVVRFNDREKREHEGTALGNFGVIDAELYTGVLDIDRSVMECDDAETLEIAMEQARGLESELDVEEPETKITVIVEGETEISEEEVEPESLFRERKTLLETQLQSGRCADLDPRTAAHELHGYAQALEDLGMIDGHDERYMVEQDIFGATPPPQAPEWKEEALAYICDELCKQRIPGRTQEELDAICEKCRVGRWAADPPTLTPQEVRELRNLRGLLKEVDDYINGGDTPDIKSSQDVDLVPTRRLGRAELSGDDPYKPLDKRAERIGSTPDTGSPPKATQDTFKNTPSGIRNDRNTKKVYALGLMLAEECPDNDCRIYLNIFNIAREFDAAVDKVGRDTASARVLRSALIEKAGELWQMYEKNYAVQKFREEAQK